MHAAIHRIHFIDFLSDALQISLTMCVYVCLFCLFSFVKFVLFVCFDCINVCMYGYMYVCLYVYTFIHHFLRISATDAPCMKHDFWTASK